MVLAVEDNGCGADVGHIKELMSKPPESEKAGYGLYNIQQRIKLYYGEEYGIEPDRTENGGMSFRIILPICDSGE